MSNTKKIDAAVEAERERCCGLAEAVRDTALRMLKLGSWSPQDRIAWEARARAADDVECFIRKGVSAEWLTGMDAIKAFGTPSEGAAK